MILKDSLSGDCPIIGWSVLLTFTAISTGFNVVHSSPDIVSRLAHAVPPVALCISIELLMLCIKSDLQQAGHTIQITDSQVNQEVITRQKDCRKRVTTTDRIRDYYMKYPNSSITTAARELGMSRNTIRRYRNVAAMQEEV